MRSVVTIVTTSDIKFESQQTITHHQTIAQLLTKALEKQ